MLRLMIRNAVCVLVLFLWLLPVNAQPQPATTPQVFKQYSAHVVKVEVVETGSAAKATTGTGFYATAGGDIVTNYHVVSKLIHSPARYRIELTDTLGKVSPATVIAVDVIYDLAVLRSAAQHEGFLAVDDGPLQQGARLYSFGHPKDLGLTIVEGTYNGLLKHTLYPKIHFTGSLNPGMSGGPTLTAAGKVIGINVATEGEQISYLVPAARVVGLLAKAAGGATPSAEKFLPEVGKQIHSYQARYLTNLFSANTPRVVLGPYDLPTKPTEFFRCWADAVRRKELPYTVVNHLCSTDDYVFITGQQSSGIVHFYHQLLATEELNPSRFFTLYSTHFQAGNEAQFGSEEEVTSFRCNSQNVKTAAGKLKAVLCARRYVKLPGLHDAVLKVAPLGGNNVGLVSALSLSGASFENIQALSRRYMESIQWRR